MSEEAAPALLWEGQPPTYWRARWSLPELHVFDRVGSTNDIARDRALAGAPAGTVVMTELQTAGRGRLGRRWLTPPASSLLLSCVLRPTLATDAAPGTLPLRIGLAAAAAIEQIVPVRVMLKWPNDLVLAAGGKVGGILCEAITSGAAWSIVAGIGINVRQQSQHWPPELRTVATSLDAASDIATDRAALATALLQHLSALFTAPLAPLTDAELQAFRQRDRLLDRAVVVEADERADAAEPGRAGIADAARGTGAGVARDGALLLRTTSGIERVTTGSVRIHDSSRSTTASRTYP